MRPPIIPHPETGEDQEYTPEWAAARAAEEGYEVGAEYDAYLYPWASLGWAEELTGSGWECCPRSYQRFSPEAARIVATEAVSAVIDRDRSMPPIVPYDSLSQRGRRLYRIAFDAVAKCRDAAAREKAAAKGKRR